MASSLFGSSQTPPRMGAQNNPLQMMQQLRQFAGLVRGRGDPQQMVMAYMQQHGIPQEQLQQTIQQAKEIGQMLGLK